MTADTRNWKCFIGMHQWQQFGDAVKTCKYEDSSSKRPYRIYTTYKLKCVHCGEITSRRIE